ncbi:pyrimidine-nucleoside phosphorylase [Brevibacillus humidisoli]|uniref:pyrimidine-nucleoside phosphorylase n=1 Tax=Brevibacillus humidisoli TaxID=2895522 RepID=UPI001E52C4CA|nr:pyrimidine-nucleoside phosphorylase [Brevibacillus humidisoli]UFJ42867.1 pyrimidine-nucleoside phosphorylase [Brevibacillus humidisoli]
MNMVDLIAKKRDGGVYAPEEIAFIIRGYTDGSIPDYQMSAWAMAVFFQGMTPQETAELTLQMAESGEQLDLSPIPGCKVDKHSTGGVGDKTTLIVAPLVAAAGIPVAKMSGRGLGFSGGTIDKLESFPGFQVELSRDQFFQQVRDAGLAIIGQSGNLTPADKKLYALRDVTATVEAVPLIASSIMSKKIAAGADAILLDVKVGRGAFMKTLDQANELAQAMVQIGHNVGRQTVAVISDMNQPLGFAVGNALEVKEAIAVLSGQGPRDVEDLALTIGAHMLLLAGQETELEAAYQRLQTMLQNGKALAKLAEMVQAQGGDPAFVYEPDRLPQAAYTRQLLASRSGYLSQMDAEKIGQAAVLLGAGRVTKETPIDLTVGILLNNKVGDAVEKGGVLAEIHANDLGKAEQAIKKIESALEIVDQSSSTQRLIYDVVSAS